MKSTAGYTLLEMLMVLVLFSMIAGIAVPRLTTVYSSMKWSMEKDDVLKRISGLGRAARNAGRGFALSRYPVETEGNRSTSRTTGANDDLSLQKTGKARKIPLDLPEGWRLKAEPPIYYTGEGVCLGGKLTIMYDRIRIEAILRPPFGRIEFSQERALDGD